eukprot:192713-Rhodomonas_salina.2
MQSQYPGSHSIRAAQYGAHRCPRTARACLGARYARSVPGSTIRKVSTANRPVWRREIAGGTVSPEVCTSPPVPFPCQYFARSLALRSGYYTTAHRLAQDRG